MLSQGGKKGHENIKQKTKTSWEITVVPNLLFLFT
jgi:hypothetical protein